MSENEAPEVAEDNIEDAAEEAPETGLSDSGDEGEREAPDLESADLARARGWKPRSEWKGRVPEGFIDDPDEYNSVFEESMPRVVRQNRELQAKVENFEQQFRHMADWRKRVEEDDRRARERDIRRIENELREAVTSGDMRKHTALLKERDELTTPPPAQQDNYDADRDPAFADWVGQNPWYDRKSGQFDGKRAAFAEAKARELMAQGRHPSTEGRAYYEAISAAVNAEFSEKPQAKADPGVEGGRRPASRGRAPKKITTWADLPAEQRNAPHVMATVNGLYGGDRNKYAQDWARNQQEKNQ